MLSILQHRTETWDEPIWPAGPLSRTTWQRGSSAGLSSYDESRVPACDSLCINDAIYRCLSADWSRTREHANRKNASRENHRSRDGPSLCPRSMGTDLTELKRNHWISSVEDLLRRRVATRTHGARMGASFGNLNAVSPTRWLFRGVDLRGSIYGGRCVKVSHLLWDMYRAWEKWVSRGGKRKIGVLS